MIYFSIFTIITDRVRALESSKINLVKMSVHNRNTHECICNNIMHIIYTIMCTDKFLDNVLIFFWKSKCSQSILHKP